MLLLPQRLRLTKPAVDGLQPDSEIARLLNDITNHILTLKSSPTAPQSDPLHHASDRKKRKLDGVGSSQSAPSNEIQDPVTLFECKDVSFAAPARKKVRLELVSSASDPEQRQIRLYDPKTSELEYVLGAQDVDQTFCLPVPDKAQRQKNFVILPRRRTETSEKANLEQILFTMNETPDKVGALGARSTEIAEGETYASVTTAELRVFLLHQGKNIVLPDDREFASSIEQPHRKGEKAHHVKAFRGSKEGYLFFLPTGILFGFKKPLALFPFHNVESISYTSVLQRTFNLVITTIPSSADDAAEEVEFSMLDQADFAGIDSYIKAHGLNDASLAAERRAKAYNVNKNSKAASSNNAGDEADGDDGQTELQKAEQQLQDEEDDMEEDYDPSGGESEGEGEESEEEAKGYVEDGVDDGDETGNSGEDVDE